MRASTGTEDPVDRVGYLEENRFPRVASALREQPARTQVRPNAHASRKSQHRISTHTPDISLSITHTQKNPQRPMALQKILQNKLQGVALILLACRNCEEAFSCHCTSVLGGQGQVEGQP